MFKIRFVSDDGDHGFLLDWVDKGHEVLHVLEAFPISYRVDEHQSVGPNRPISDTLFSNRLGTWVQYLQADLVVVYGCGELVRGVLRGIIFSDESLCQESHRDCCNLLSSLDQQVECINASLTKKDSYHQLQYVLLLLLTFH